MLRFVLAKITIMYVSCVSYALPQLPLSSVRKW